MKQSEIMLLLKEASNPECPNKRAIEIQAILGDEITSRECRTDRERVTMDVFDAIFNELFCNTKRHKPDLLPSQFPIFAILCGDVPKGSFFSEVDWGIMDLYFSK